MARVRVQVPVEHKPELAPVTPPRRAQERPEVPRGNSPLKKALLILAIIIGVLFINSLIQDRNRLQKQLETNASKKPDTTEIVANLSRSVELPLDEQPEVRTIEDASKFTEQNPSLSDIKNGDMLLFFAKSKKVVVYRPVTKKAVVVVTLAEPAATESTPNASQN